MATLIWDPKIEPPPTALEDGDFEVLLEPDSVQDLREDLLEARSRIAELEVLLAMTNARAEMAEERADRVTTRPDVSTSPPPRDSTIRPPPNPELPDYLREGGLPERASRQPSTRGWRAILETVVATIRPGRRAK